MIAHMTYQCWKKSYQLEWYFEKYFKRGENQQEKGIRSYLSQTFAVLSISACVISGYDPVVRGLMATSYHRVGEKMSIDQKNIMQTYYLDDFNGCPIKKVVGELQDIFTPTPSFPILNIQDHPLQISNQIFAFLRPSPSPPNFEYPILSAPIPPPKLWIVIRSLLYHFLSHGTAVRMSVPHGISRLPVVTT